MPSLQQIIVFVIVAFCLLYVVRKVACFFRNQKGTSSKCDGCAGCALKDLKRK